MVTGNKKNKTNILIKSEERDVNIWKTRIDIAKDFVEKNFKNNAERWRDFYKGIHWRGQNLAERSDRIVINYTYSIIKAIIPQIYYRDPYIYVTANKEKYASAQQLAEDVINYYWRAMHIKKQMRRIILDMLVLGIGVGKLGYYTDLIKKEKDPNLETNMEYSYLVKDEYPYFLRQSPFDMVFDFEAKSFDDLRWLATRYYVPLETVKSNDMYKNTSKLEGKYSVIDKDTHKKVAKGTKEAEEDLKRVELWEIQDLVDNKIYTICDEADKFLRNIDNPYNLDGSNYKILYVNEIPDELFPISEVTNLEDLNLEYDISRTQLLKHKRKSQRKILYEDGVFENDEEAEKFLNEDDMVAVKVAPDKLDKITVFNPSMVNAELYNICDAILFDMNNISRVGFNQRAVESNVEKTATEANIIEKNANLGNAERLDVITDYSQDIARDLLKIIQNFASKEQEFYVDKRNEWVKFKKDDIAGDYNIKIEIGSTVRKNSDADRAIALQIFQSLVNLTDEQGRLIANRRVLAEKLMKKMGLTGDEIQEIMTPVENYPGQPVEEMMPMGQPEGGGIPINEAGGYEMQPV